MSNIPELIESLRDAISRSDNNKANETTLALFESISAQFLASAETDAKIIEQIAAAPERKVITVDVGAATTEQTQAKVAELKALFEEVTPAPATTEKAPEPVRDPLDHDGDGKKGGSVPKSKRAPKAGE